MKAYVKPELYFESYELSQHIAACGWDVSMTEEKCSPYVAYYDPSLDNSGKSDPNAAKLFYGNTPECSVKDYQLEGYCYTTGTDDFRRIWNS